MWHGLTRAVQMWASLGVEAGVNTMLLVVDSEVPHAWRLLGLQAKSDMCSASQIRLKYDVAYSGIHLHLQTEAAPGRCTGGLDVSSNRNKMLGGND